MYSAVVPAQPSILEPFPDPLPWSWVEVQRQGDGKAAALRLPEREIHIWRVELTPRALHRYSGKAQAGANGGNGHALEHSLAIRSTSRQLLATIAASYFDSGDPSGTLWHEPQGQPHLGSDEIRVSVSHTQGLALFALARQPVGIDVELDYNVAAAQRIAQHYFAPDEYARFDAGRQTGEARFVQYWTRKEAYLKALGQGFRHSPQLVDASSDFGSGLVLNALDPFESLRWVVRSFRVSDEHIAAVAHARGRGIVFRWLAAAHD